MTPYANAFLDRVSASYRTHRHPGEAAAMAAYMRDQFPFIGIPAPTRVRLLRDAEHELGRPTEQDLRDVAREAWARPEREFQYAATWLVRRRGNAAGPSFLSAVRRMITTKSWWDTVDELAVHVVGGLVRRSPELAPTMDEWANSSNIWLTRSAILHQLRYRNDADIDRLFGYCAARASDGEFFVRKAIGWALREQSKTHPGEVGRFLRRNKEVLSGLSYREARKHLDIVEGKGS